MLETYTQRFTDLERIMREETDEAKRPLRTGFTTGACATVTSYAAARLLLTGEPCTKASIDLPKGQRVEFELAYCRHANNHAEAGVIKDAGDDPDVTHGALIMAAVSLQPEPGVSFVAGSGVGTVTRTGLALAIGEPAINPVPRRMMTEHLASLAAEYEYNGGFTVTLAVKDGEALAQKTMNPRLGIIGGLSILGTTGIVRPFSCSAYIASIHQGIDVAKANGHRTIAASTGNTSEASIRQIYDLPDMALIEMGDFAGAVLKYLKQAPVEKLVIAGGFGKLSKLAQGHLDLHSRKSSIDLDFIAQTAEQQGGSSDLTSKIKAANTSLEALSLCQQQQVPLGDAICQSAQTFARSIVPDTVEVEVWAFDKQGHLVGSAV